MTAASWPPLFVPSRRRHFLTVVLCGLGQAVAAGATALLIRHTFDALLRSESGPFFWDALFAGVGFAIAGSVILALRVVERGAAEAFAQKYIAQLRQRIFQQVINADQRAFKRKRRGHLMVRFVGDLGAVRNWIADGISKITVAAIVIPIVAAVLLSIHAKIIIVVLTIFLLSLGLVLIMRSSLRARHAAARHNRGKMAGELGEKLTSAPVILAFGQFQREKRRLTLRSQDVIGASVRRRRHSALAVGLPDLASSFALGVVIVLGTAEIVQGTATPGAIIAILTTLSLLSVPLKDLAMVFDKWRNFSVAKEKIGALLAIPQLKTAPKEGDPLTAGDGRIEISGLRIEGVVHDFTRVLASKRVVAVMGSNGAGKSMLLMAVAGLVDVQGGSIKIDGCDYSVTRRRHLRREIGVCSADLPLLRGSLRRNITYRSPSSDKSEFLRIVELCGLAPLIASLPDREDTRLSEGAAELSPGWRARIQLARACAGKPRLLILDEPDQSLDEEGQAVLRNLLTSRQATTLIATKSPAIAALADEIWTINEGAIEINRSSQSLTPLGPVYLRSVTKEVRC